MINLLPPEVKSNIKFARMNVTLVVYCVIAFITSICLVIILYFGSTVLTASQEEINDAIDKDNKTIAELQTYHAEANKIANTVNTLSQVLNREVKFSELLQEIGSILPSGAALTNLTVSENRDDPLSFDAIVTTETIAAITRENIVASDLFESADINTITSTPPTQSGGVTYNYVVSFQATFSKGDEALPQLDVQLEDEPAQEATE